MASNKPTIAFDYSGQPTVSQSIITVHARTMRPRDLMRYRASIRGNRHLLPDAPIRPESETEEFMNVRQGDVVFTHVDEETVNTEPVAFSAFDGYSKGAICGRVRILGVAQTDQRTEDSLSDDLLSVAVFGGHHIINTGRMRVNCGDRLLAFPPDLSPARPRLHHGHLLPDTTVYQRFVAEIFPAQKFVDLIRDRAGINEALHDIATFGWGNQTELGTFTAPLHPDADDSAQVIDEWLRIELARRILVLHATDPQLRQVMMFGLIAAIVRTDRNDVTPGRLPTDEDVGALLTATATRVFGAISSYFDAAEFWHEICVAGDDNERYFRVVMRAIDKFDDARRALVDSYTLGYSLGTAEPGQQLDVLICKPV